MANGKAHGGNPLDGNASAWFGGGTGVAFFVLCAFLAIATHGFGGTIAMYNFKERPAGASAIGVTITNSMGAAHSGTASATATGSIGSFFTYMKIFLTKPTLREVLPLSFLLFHIIRGIVIRV